MFETERIDIWSDTYNCRVYGVYIHEHGMFVPTTPTPPGVEFAQWLYDLQDDYEEQKNDTLEEATQP